MEHVRQLFEAIREKLSGTAIKDAVVSKPLSAGDRHVLVFSEVSMGLGVGNGSGETSFGDKRSSKGVGGGGGGGAKASPVAVLVVENGKVRLETLG